MSDFVTETHPDYSNINRGELIGKRVQVLGNEHCWIELQDFMGSDQDIVAAARTSRLGYSKGESKDRALLYFLMRNRHTSPFEMCEMKFRVSAPVVTWWQWTRHRTFSFNLQSLRYMEADGDKFYIPQADEWRGQSKGNRQASEGHLDYSRGMHFTERMEAILDTSMLMYQDMLDQGVAREQARLVLPGFAAIYQGVVKTDLHNLLHFCNLRMAPEAQYEIRSYADCIYGEFIEPLFPWTAAAYNEFQATYNKNDSRAGS